MSIYCYSLRIDTEEQNHDNVSALLGIEIKDYSCGWIYEISSENESGHIGFVNVLMDVICGKFEQLEAIGIKRNDISIWAICEYDNQFSIEFEPYRLKRLGDEGITLCLSCFME